MNTQILIGQVHYYRTLKKPLSRESYHIICSGKLFLRLTVSMRNECSKTQKLISSLCIQPKYILSVSLECAVFHFQCANTVCSYLEISLQTEFSLIPHGSHGFLGFKCITPACCFFCAICFAPILTIWLVLLLHIFCVVRKRLHQKDLLSGIRNTKLCFLSETF